MFLLFLLKIEMQFLKIIHSLFCGIAIHGLCIFLKLLYLIDSKNAIPFRLKFLNLHLTFNVNN